MGIAPRSSKVDGDGYYRKSRTSRDFKEVSDSSCIALVILNTPLLLGKCMLSYLMQLSGKTRHSTSLSARYSA